MLSASEDEINRRNDIIMTGRYFPYAKRMNAVVGHRNKYWFHLAGVNPDGSFGYSLPRITDLDDRTVTDRSGEVEQGFEQAKSIFSERFNRFLTVLPSR